MVRMRVALLVTAVTAIVMIAGTIGIGLIGKTAGVKRLTDTLRPAFTSQAVTRARSNFNEIQAMAHQLDTQAAPALATQLHTTPTGFNHLLAADFPAVASGLSQLPSILPRFNALLTGIQAEQGNFHKADAIVIRKPLHLGPRLVPWLLIVPGAIVLAFAVLALLRGEPWVRASPVVVAVVGAVLVVAPFAVSVPAKARAVDGLTAAFAPSMKPAAVRQTVRDMATVQAMSDQLESKLLPALASDLKVTPAQLQTSLGSHFPAFARGVRDLPRILPGFQGLVGDLRTVSGSDFQDASSIPWRSTSTTTLTWLFVIPGGLLVLAGALPLAWRRERTDRREAIGSARVA